MKHNLTTIASLGGNEWLDTDKRGFLTKLPQHSQKIWIIKNLLLFGAIRRRLNHVIFLSFLTFLLELTNPFDKAILKQILEKKIRFVQKHLSKVRKINGKLWDTSTVEHEMHVYERRSLLQSKVIQEIVSAASHAKLTESVKEAKAALKKGYFPLLITQGCSGAYWMRDTKREIVGLFKPFDEEIHAPNNPIGPRYQGALGERKTRAGVRVGEAGHREVAAYLVDRFFGFGIVPNTCYATFVHHTFFDARENLYGVKRTKVKYGSFQEYVSGFNSYTKLSEEDIKKVDLDEFQLLVLLDIIIGNTDRNAGNFLISDEKIAAVDHGLCFPDRHDYYSTWYWYLPLGEKPFYSTIIELLDHFPFDKLSWKLKKNCFISTNSLRCMKERIVVVHNAFKEGLNSPKLLAPFYADLKWNQLNNLDKDLEVKAKELIANYLLEKDFNKK